LRLPLRAASGSLCRRPVWSSAFGPTVIRNSWEFVAEVARL
jgi:hypothetical protein